MTTTQPAHVAVREEEEEMPVPVKELDRYFLSPSASSASSPISNYLEDVHEHLSRTFPTNPVVSAQLQKSLLRVAKSADSSVASKVKEAYQYLAVKLKTLVFNYKVYEECKSSNLKSLTQLSKLRAQGQFQVVDLSQKNKQ